VLGSGAASNASGITEGKITRLPKTIRVSLVYAGNGTDSYDTTVDVDTVP